MGTEPLFRWHEDASVFAAGTTIARDFVQAATGFLNIPAAPASQALYLLGSAVRSRQSFCIAPTGVADIPPVECPAFLTFTGGSSGAPKIIRRTQASWIASFEQNSRLFGLTPHDTVATLGALSHSLALYAMLEAMHLGMDVHMLEARSPRAQGVALEQHAVSVLYATPTQLRALAMGAKGALLPRVRLVLCGGGDLSAETLAQVQVLCPNADVRQFYGAAETSFITLTDSQTPMGSVGHAYPGVRLLIDQGEVWVQSPYLFIGYAQDDSTDTRWQDGFLSVGEMGWLDADGNLWLEGRRSRMVTIADQNVFPEAIERALTQTLDGQACAVLPVPDPVRGHRLVVVLEGTPDRQVAQDVKTICRTQFGNMRAPQRVLFCPQMPQLPSGKPDLSALSRWMEQQA